MAAEIENALGEANVNFKGEFVCQAVEFYLGYLRSRKDVDYLAPILGSTIKSEVRSLETHLSEMLFKLAVESAKVNHLLAAQSEVPEEAMERLNRMCCEDVASNNGRVTFENAYAFQHDIVLNVTDTVRQDKAMMLQKISAGITNPWEYRVAFKKEDEDTAKAMFSLSKNFQISLKCDIIRNKRGCRNGAVEKRFPAGAGYHGFRGIGAAGSLTAEDREGHGL